MMLTSFQTYLLDCLKTLGCLRTDQAEWLMGLRFGSTEKQVESDLRRLQYMGKDVIAAAPTGVAALNIKSDAFGSGSVGMTIHSLFAIKAKTIEPYPKLLKSSKEAKPK